MLEEPAVELWAAGKTFDSLVSCFGLRIIRQRPAEAAEEPDELSSLPIHVLKERALRLTETAAFLIDPADEGAFGDIVQDRETAERLTSIAAKYEAIRGHREEWQTLMRQAAPPQQAHRPKLLGTEFALDADVWLRAMPEKKRHFLIAKFVREFLGEKTTGPHIAGALKKANQRRN
jgi:hypothetical protein